MESTNFQILFECPRKYDSNQREFCEVTSLEECPLMSQCKKNEITQEYQELTRETTLDEIAEILSKTIVYDEVNKRITFLSMLTVYSEEDQLNLAFKGESSSGKTYLLLQAAKLFPEEDVEMIGYASPTSFFHEKGRFDSERKCLVNDKSHKIIIYMDLPHDELLRRLRPMASHDKKVIEVKITDRTEKYGLRALPVELIGYPVFCFATARLTMDEQEKTRCFMLSPEVSQEKILASLMLQEQRNANPNFEKEIEQDPKRMWLKERIKLIKQANIQRIIIPDKYKILEKFQTKHKILGSRATRDFPRLLGLIKAHSLLNLWNRNYNEETKEITADEIDVEAGYSLYEKIAVPNELGVTPWVYQVYQDILTPIFDEVESNLGDEVDEEMLNGIDRRQIRQRYYQVYGMTLNDSNLNKQILPSLRDAGLIDILPDPNDRRKQIIVREKLNASDGVGRLHTPPKTTNLDSIFDSKEKGDNLT